VGQERWQKESEGRRGRRDRRKRNRALKKGKRLLGVKIGPNKTTPFAQTEQREGRKKKKKRKQGKHVTEIPRTEL